jgi:hypothetical protein
LPIGISAWGKEVDYSAFPDSVSLAEARLRGTDSHSVHGPLTFENPRKGDFRVNEGAKYRKIILRRHTRRGSDLEVKFPYGVTHVMRICKTAFAPHNKKAGNHYSYRLHLTNL